MKNQIKRIISLLLVIMITCITTSAFANFSDVPETALYANSLERLSALGIFSGNVNGEFRPDEFLTREQFAKVIVVAAGLEDIVTTMNGVTEFPDVSPNGWSSGYINTALKKGFITGAPDGKFHPSGSITYSQVCAAIVRALGYTDQDVAGLWPRNYVDKARALGITDGINLGNNDAVPRWAAALMIDKLLSTNIKKNNPSEPDRTFLDASGFYDEYIVLGNSTTSDKITGKQVLTDKGIFYNATGNTLELGNKYNLAIKEDTIVKASGKLNAVKEISVNNAVDTLIKYVNGSQEENMILPDKTVYYYQGVKQNYENLKTILQKNTSIVFGYNSTKTGYEYAVIFDPIYSKPEVALNFVPSTKKLGSISFIGEPLIIRNGEFIDVSQIVKKDIVYQITDIWNRNKYILVVDNKIAGEITDVLPNKLSPKMLQIDNTNYEFSKDIDYNKINNSPGAFNVGSYIILLLGYDGKIVGVEYFGSEDNSNYALVLNNSYSISTNSDGTKNIVYSAKLLFSDGITAVYNVASNAAALKGKLVKYSFVDDRTIALEQIPYNFLGEVFIKKDDRMIDTSYVADNVKIFNVVFNDATKDIQASLIEWNDIPGGTIPQGKIWHVNTTGTFKDINLIFTDDIFDERYKTAVVKTVNIIPSGKGSSYEYILLIDGKEIKYGEHIPNASTGSVLRAKLSISGIDSIIENRLPGVKATKVQALDAKRIKINDTVYWFKNNVPVCFKDYKGEVTVKGLMDIKTNQEYDKVELYFDKPVSDGGKVEAIIVYE